MKILRSSVTVLLCGSSSLSAAQQRKDTIVTARDGSGDYHMLTKAMEGIRAFMDYKVAVLVKKGVYKEKVILPSWLENVDFIGENAENTIITYDDYVNINKMGTFRTYTLRVEGNSVTFKNLTIENNAARLGQIAVPHTESDRLIFINRRSLRNQDTIYTGAKGTQLYLLNRYIEGIIDFTFGPSTALLWNCTIHSKSNSYITAVSTPKDVEVGCVLKDRKLIAAPGADKVYLGRPWRPYTAMVFINYEMGRHIRPEDWRNWGNSENEKAARYVEFGSTGEGVDYAGRVKWAEQLTGRETVKYGNPAYLLERCSEWKEVEP